MRRFSKRQWMVSIVAVVLTLGLAVGVVGAATQADILFDRIRLVYNVVSSWHKDGADMETFVDGAIKGGLEALGDPYTNYFNPTEFADFIDGLNGTLSGIGAYLEQDDDYVIITGTVKGSPAAKAGLMTGDRILEVNGQPMVGASMEKVRTVVRGEAGTDVTLRIERPLEHRTMEITITREVITIPEVESEMLDSEIGYILISSFGDNASQDFYKAVEQLKAQGAKGLVLDLRGNPGGYLDAAVEIASAFVPAGQPVVWEVGRNGEKTSQKSTGRLINLPTTVLVDQGSASASEVLAGAIQDYQAGTLVGTKTFGKGTVQTILTLMAGGGMKVTVAEYLTPKERHVQGVGLLPDHLVQPYRPNEERTAPLTWKKNLQRTDVGLDVLYLQYRLEDLGYTPELNGFFGLKTADAVKQLAAANGLGANEVVTKQFMEMLNAKVDQLTKIKAQQDPQLKRAHELAIFKARAAAK